ncbi:acetate--CoA ligase [Rhodocaloribacter litoris]|uniref:acetate--CoA ligase n=1 Tax=Rhodocaloribacter litoris TaxID=2558931 RepID=UPI001421599F|nr:acetate--CoA ligase [Rhodocaloribacter litoris]QXD15291.1 acetate--CoA ligase [Rhodocaloribacter litoris]GIV62292.1 MAG: acetyl-coenzyme A synthetase 2 [Rhodothermaceae bacterium]
MADHVRSSEALYEAPPAFKARAHIASMEEYERMYRRSIEDPEGFWREQARRLFWFHPFHTVRDASYGPGDVHIRWFDGGRLNAAYNCLDRHLERRGDQTALIFEPDDPEEPARHITYRELYEEVCRFANVLRAQGVERGDRVTIYLPMIPEVACAMLACARIGAIHSVVFAGFSPEALADRILDGDSRLVITADEGMRGGRRVPLKQNVDRALRRCPGVENVIVVRRTGGDIDWVEGRDVWYHEAREQVAATCPAVPMEAEDPLFILYTSGSTGKPKGVLHTTGGYLLYASLTHQYVFDYHDGDVYWCTADVGWITGHSYIVYGPLANGATQVFFEGVPTYPDPGRFWQVVERHRVNQFYTAPTAIRALMAQGDDYVRRADRSSLRLLGTVGEPINPEAWRWYHEVVGDGRCPIVDTWWQTETGGIMITPLPGAIPQKPGSATRPFFGIQPEIVDENGRVLDGPAAGILVIKEAWPGQARTVYGDHDRFVQTYFSAFPGKYFTGDGCRRDEDGYYWITGRVDDVLNVSGHRLGTAEIESALVLHPAVAEAAVVGYPHPIKGQGIYCYVTLNVGETPSDALREELVKLVAEEISPIARPDKIQFAPALPKTRSGKIMRRILRKIAADEYDQLGDTSTLADPGVVEALIRGRQQP